MTWTLLVLPVLLFVLGLPIYIVLLAAASTTMLLFMNVPTIALHQVMFGGIDNYALLAVPFFIFAGDLMARGGIAQRLTSWVLALVGHMRGSLGLTTVGTATILGAISGSSPATVAAVSQTLYPGLVKAGYEKRFTLGLVTSSGSIAIVVPPSIAMILYGATAEESIPKLFIAGILPGLLLAGFIGLYIAAWSRRHHVREEGTFDFWHAFATTRSALAALALPIFVLGGIYFGFFSPTEAGGFACLYAIVISRYVMRSLDWTGVLASAAQASYLTAQVLIIVASAGVLSWVFSVHGIPQALLDWIAGLELSAVGFLLSVNVLLLLLGCVLDPTSAILVLTPMLIPVVMHLGIDPIHFGVIMTVNLSIGMFTPPFGLNIFVVQSILAPDVADIYRGLMPFVLVQLLALLVITFVPQLSLWLTKAV